jgi:hypothetical protein
VYVLVVLEMVIIREDWGGRYLGFSVGWSCLVFVWRLTGQKSLFMLSYPSLFIHRLFYFRMCRHGAHGW